MSNTVISVLSSCGFMTFGVEQISLLSKIKINKHYSRLSKMHVKISQANRDPKELASNNGSWGVVMGMLSRNV